jgi:predicted nucleic acid-binding protein
MLFLVDSDATYHAHYCRANVCISEDWDTRQVTVSAYIGTAPDDTTVIVYPYRKDEMAYLSKSNARKLAAQFKRELREYVKAKGIKLSEPIAYTEYFQ